MGACFLIVNPTRRQYLDPWRFSEDDKFAGVLAGKHCLSALKLLIKDDVPDHSRRHSICGAWVGDPVILASDDCGQPNPGGLVTATSTDPARNLNHQAKAEFSDISYLALAELCRNMDRAVELVSRSRMEGNLLLDLVTVLEQYHPEALNVAIHDAFGQAWRKEYDRALAQIPDWTPLPRIDWPVETSEPMPPP